MNKIKTYHYQVVFLGEHHYIEKTRSLLEEELMEDGSKLLLYCAPHEVDFRLPVAGVYFGKKGCFDKDKENVCWLLSKGVHILPVVEDLTSFAESVTKELTPFNAVEVKNAAGCRNVVDYLLTEFRLLRGKKKVFISYCRKDADKLAHQLYDELSHRKYDVFLDSYSIDCGLDFQEELQEFLADSDVMVFLHSPESMKSRWVKVELAKVNRLQIGVVEVKWPDIEQTSIRLNAELTYPLLLNNLETHCPYCLPDICHKIADVVDHWRVRSMQARVANLKSPLLHHLRPEQITLYPSSVVASRANNKIQIYVPVVGLPCAVDYEKTKRWITCLPETDNKVGVEARIVYDHLYLKKENIAHLKWLDSYLPVKSLNIRILTIKQMIMKKHHLKKVFLSASIPSPERNPKYYQTVDVIAVRDAIRALAANVLPYVHLVWGGHPSITPLIREVLEGVGVTPEEIKEHVTLYQSRFFEGMFPKDNECVEDIQLTDICYINGQKDRDGSLEEMRHRMLDTSHDYVAGIFIGGMEGVEEECRLFRECHPSALLLPIASTGAAALHLMKDRENVKSPEGFDLERLKTDFDYQTLFEHLFKDIIGEWNACK